MTQIPQIKKIQVENASGSYDQFSVGSFSDNIANALTISSKDNFQITSPVNAQGQDTKSINIEPNKSLKIKPGQGGQVEFIADNSGELEEFLLKVFVTKDSEGQELSGGDKPIRLKIQSQELELNTKNGEDEYDVKFKTGLKKNSSGDHYCKTRLKGRSIDLRCYEHGGIAMQPCGTDSNGKENKFKIETSRTTELGDTSVNYSDEGGKGMEIFTMNSEHMSAWAGDYRFRADSPVYAVTRGTLVTDDDKTDYPTQSDDFKDIIDDENPITWADIIAATKYFKSLQNQ